MAGFIGGKYLLFGVKWEGNGIDVVVIFVVYDEEILVAADRGDM